MSRDYEPVPGQWYENLEEEEPFRVLSMDEDSELVEIEYLDGDIEEIDLETWHEMDLELTQEPEGWSESQDEERRRRGEDDDWDDEDEDDDDLDEDEDEDEPDEREDTERLLRALTSLDNWYHEKESAWLYLQVAAVEPDPRKRQLFLRLAAAAEQQAASWLATSG